MTELLYLDPRIDRAARRDGRPTFFLVDDAAINGQWRGRNADLAMRAVEDARGLLRVNESGIWTLYEVAPI